MSFNALLPTVVLTCVRSSPQRFLATTALIAGFTVITWMMLTFSEVNVLMPPQFYREARIAFKTLFLSGNKKDLEASINMARRDSRCIDTKPDNWTTPRFSISLLEMKKPRFLKNYRNPCWYDKSSDDASSLRCLPYFYVAGFPKCGTTDLFFRLTQHPLIIKGAFKEPHYLTRNMFSKTCKEKSMTMKDASTCAVEHYTSWFFKGAARAIRRNREGGDTPRFKTHIGAMFRRQLFQLWRVETKKIQHPMITVDASASTAWDNRRWKGIAENAGCPSPAVGTAHIVARLNPKVKIIFILRDPTERLYSDYVYFNRKVHVSPEDFHTRVVSSIVSLRNCTNHSTLKLCLMQDHAVRIGIGLYYEYISEWLQVLPRSQIHVIHSETYRVDVVGTLTQAFQFLQLPNLSKQHMEAIANLQEKNTNKRKTKVGHMLPETELLLREFYAEHNEKLARNLQDERFAWRRKVVLEKG